MMKPIAPRSKFPMAPRIPSWMSSLSVKIEMISWVPISRATATESPVITML